MNPDRLAVFSAVVALGAVVMSSGAVYYARKERRIHQEERRIHLQLISEYEDTLVRVRRLAVQGEPGGLVRPNGWHAGYLACANTVLEELEKPRKIPVPEI